MSKTSEKLKRTMTKINDEMALTQINHDSALRKAERKAMEVGERVETAREIPTEIKENMDGLVDNILSQRADTIKGLVEPFSKSLDLSGKEFNTMYNEIKEVFGDNGINIFDEIVSLNKAVDAVGLDAFDTATVNKINKLNGLLEERIAVKTNQIAKSAVPGPTDFQAVQPVMPKATKDVFNVSEAIAMKQDMFDISRSIFEKKGGSAVKSGIGQDINQIIDSLDNKINRATGGASSEVNTAYNGYKTIQNVTKSIVKDFKGELGDEVGGRNRPATGEFSRRQQCRHTRSACMPGSAPERTGGTAYAWDGMRLRSLGRRWRSRAGAQPDALRVRSMGRC